MPDPCTLTFQAWGYATLNAITNVNIDSYQTEPWFAADGFTCSGYRTTISGTGMVVAEVWSGIRTYLRGNSVRLNYAKLEHISAGLQGSVIELRESTNATAFGTAQGGPYMKLTGTEVIGTDLVLIRWELTDHSAVCDQPIISHVWQQKWSVDATGRQQRTITGQVRAYMAATAAGTALPKRNGSTWLSTAPYADLFRECVLPEVPDDGWRREQQDFAYDIHSTALEYTIVDKQYAHDLPDGVRVGDMEFTYERSAQDAGIATLRFSCDLEGDLNLKVLPNTTTPIRVLVEAAIKLSKTRINANYRNCLITRMMITEKQMLSGFALRFELEAQVFPSSSATAQVFTPLAFMVGNRFKVTKTPTELTQNPYGARTLPWGPNGVQGTGTPRSYWMVPHYIGNTISGMRCSPNGSSLPYATIGEYPEANVYGTINVTVVSGDTANNGNQDSQAALSGGKYNGSMQQRADDGSGTRIIGHTVSATKVRHRTGMIRMTAMYNDGADLLLQVEKPVVFVTEIQETAQVNSAPSKVTRPVPKDGYVVGEDWSVSFGKFDPQGNRVFTGVYERTVAMYDSGEVTPPATVTEGGYTNQVTDYAGTVRAWASPTLSVIPTISPIATNDSQELDTDVFAVSHTATPSAITADEKYAVPAETYTA